MKKKYIVKNNRDFNRIIEKKEGIKTKYFYLYYQYNEIGISRFGISVGTKLGNAVVRNKMKRRLRNIIDKYQKDYSKARDYIIIVRRSAVDLKFSDLEKAFLELTQQLN